MYKQLVHDSLAAASLAEQAVDKRIAKTVMELEDPEVIRGKNILKM